MRVLKLRRKLMHTMLNAGLYFTEPIFLSFLRSFKSTKKNPQHLKPHIFWIPPPPPHHQNVCCHSDPRQFLSYDFSAFS